MAATSIGGPKLSRAHSVGPKLKATVHWQTLYLAGHAVLYLGTCVSATMEFDPKGYTRMLGIAVQIGASAFAFKAATRPMLWRVVLILHITLLVLFAYGALLGNFPSYLGTDALAFGSVLAIWAGATPGLIERVAALYRRLLPLGLAIAAYLLSHVEPARNYGERLLTQGGIAFDHFRIRELCVPAAFLLFHDYRSKSSSLVQIVGLGLIGLFGLLTATRGEILFPLIVLASAVLYGRRKLGRIALVLLLIATLGLALPQLWRTVELSGTVANILLRFSEDDFSNGRNQEADLFLSMTNGAEWWIGRGLGGAYCGLFCVDNGFGIQIVHYGYLHLILKGGVWLACLIGGLMLAGILAGGRTRGSIQAGSAGFVLVFAVSSFGHTTFLASQFMCLFALALGSALYDRRKGATKREGAMT